MLYQENNFEIKAESNSFELAAFTTVGDRKEQQDCFGFHFKDNEGLLILCDGMGGHQSGADASMYTAEHFLKCYRSRCENESPITFLHRSIKESDIIVSSMTDESGTKLNAGTTTVSLLTDGEKLYWCSAGDSRAYLLRKGEFVQFTLDQNYRTVLDEKLRAGSISKEDYIRESGRAETLISYVGIGRLELIDYNDEALGLKSGDKIIIMSDGLYKLVSDDEIAEILSANDNISEALGALEERAESNAEKSGTARDNMTVMIVKIF